MSLSFLLLVFLFLVVLAVDSAAANLPKRELKRRARSDEADSQPAHQLLKFVETGWAGKLLLWLIGTSTAAILLIWLIKTSYWLTAAGVIIISWLILNRQRLVGLQSWLWRPAAALAAAAAWLLHFFEPLIVKLPPVKPRVQSNQIFDKEDLADLLKKQINLDHNRIDRADLDAAAAALNFSKWTVADIMVPLKNVRIVLPEEAIGPHLMDELYETGHLTFPLGHKSDKDQPLEIEGFIYIKDIVANPHKHTAKQVASHRVSYIKPQASLNSALGQCLNDNVPFLVVIDDTSQPQAVVWLEDVLEKLSGHKLITELDNPADADERQKVLE